MQVSYLLSDGVKSERVLADWRRAPATQCICSHEKVLITLRQVLKVHNLLILLVS